MFICFVLQNCRKVSRRKIIKYIFIFVNTQLCSRKFQNVNERRKSYLFSRFGNTPLCSSGKFTKEENHICFHILVICRFVLESSGKFTKEENQTYFHILAICRFVLESYGKFTKEENQTYFHILVICRFGLAPTWARDGHSLTFFKEVQEKDPLLTQFQFLFYLSISKKKLWLNV